MDTARSVNEARQQVIVKMCNRLYELAAYNSEKQQRRLLSLLDDDMSDLWSLHEVADG